MKTKDPEIVIPERLVRLLKATADMNGVDPISLLERLLVTDVERICRRHRENMKNRNARDSEPTQIATEAGVDS